MTLNGPLTLNSLIGSTLYGNQHQTGGTPMDSASIMVWSVLFGSIGMGYFMYGRRQKAIVPLCIGLSLFVFPYFMPSVTMLLIVGVILVAIPYFIRI
ncbi:MAG: putative membrane protein [Paraglaciecola sp.]